MLGSLPSGLRIGRSVRWTRPVVHRENCQAGSGSRLDVFVDISLDLLEIFLFVPDFVFPRPFELVGGLLEFGEALTQRATELGELSRTKHQQRNDKDNNQFGETEIPTHRSSVRRQCSLRPNGKSTERPHPRRTPERPISDDILVVLKPAPAKETH